MYRLVRGVNSGWLSDHLAVSQQQMLFLIGLRIGVVVSCRYDFHVWHQRVYYHDSGPAAEAAKGSAHH